MNLIQDSKHFFSARAAIIEIFTVVKIIFQVHVYYFEIDQKSINIRKRNIAQEMNDLILILHFQ